MPYKLLVNWKLTSKFQCQTVIGTNNGQICNSAASLLRKDIETLKKTTQLWMNCFFLLNSANAFVFIAIHSMFTQWKCIQPRLFSGNGIREIVEMLSNCWDNRFCFTPFHLGLALQMYHEFGSKHLVETLNANGLYAS